MCLPGVFSAPKAPPVIAAPTKTSADMQLAEEQARARLGASTNGFAGTILSKPGTTATPQVSGVTLGV